MQLASLVEPVMLLHLGFKSDCLTTDCAEQKLILLLRDTSDLRLLRLYQAHSPCFQKAPDIELIVSASL